MALSTLVTEGGTYGRLTALKPRLSTRPSGQWVCRCACGGEHVAYAHNLKFGKVRSCGCLKRDPATKRARVLAMGRVPAEDRVGEVHGRLTITALVRRVGTDWRVRCRCECGRDHETLLHNVLPGMVRSCGCLLAESLGVGRRTHGLTRTPEYAAWSSMNQRCGNPKTPGYAHYGGRGIRVCDRWRGSFESFYDDMGPRPSAKHSIDRIDNDGPYEPGNCRWATDAEQARNTSRSVYFEISGRYVAAADLYAGRVSRQLFFQRVDAGWDPELAGCVLPGSALARSIGRDVRGHAARQLASGAT